MKLVLKLLNVNVCLILLILSLTVYAVEPVSSTIASEKLGTAADPALTISVSLGKKSETPYEITSKSKEIKYRNLNNYVPTVINSVKGIPNTDLGKIFLPKLKTKTFVQSKNKIITASSTPVKALAPVNSPSQIPPTISPVENPVEKITSPIEKCVPLSPLVEEILQENPELEKTLTCAHYKKIVTTLNEFPMSKPVLTQALETMIIPAEQIHREIEEYIRMVYQLMYGKPNTSMEKPENYIAK